MYISIFYFYLLQKLVSIYQVSILSALKHLDRELWEIDDLPEVWLDHLTTTVPSAGPCIVPASFAPADSKPGTIAATSTIPRTCHTITGDHS